MKEERETNLSWTYAIASIFLLIIVVGFHSLWQMQKGKQVLYKALHEQGEALVESLQASGKNAIISNKLAQEILINRLLDNARLIDMLIQVNGCSSILLNEVVTRNNLFRVQVVDQCGRVMLDSLAPPFPSILNWLPDYRHRAIFLRVIDPILRGEKRFILEGVHQDHPIMENLFWVAIARENNQGAIIVHVDAHYMEQFRKEIGLGKLISDIAEQDGISYISFQDQQSCMVAPRHVRLPVLQISQRPTGIQTGFRRLQSGAEAYEIVRPFIFQGKVAGIFRVGLSLDKFTKNIQQSQKNSLWFGLLIIALGSGGLITIFYHQCVQYRRHKILAESLQRTERLTSIGKLAAGVAHEIRNPLNAISMAIQRLQHEYLPANEENRQEFINFTEIIRNEVTRVDKIIGNFLNFAREPKLELQEVNIPHLVDDLVFIFAAEAEKNRVKIQTEYQQGPCLQCRCDPNQIKQALINIIRNAVQAMPGGGLITVRVSQVQDRILICVADTGTGIADTARIFEIYYTSKEGGVGLGLPISQKIVEEHGGKIEVESAVGEGSEFRIWLPVKPMMPVVEMKQI
ncbi:MAG: ATP-binding protein [bacterium]